MRSPRGRNQLCRLFWRLVQGYWFCGGLKFAYSHRNWRSPLKLSELPFRLWLLNRELTAEPQQYQWDHWDDCNTMTNMFHVRFYQVHIIKQWLQSVAFNIHLTDYDSSVKSTARHSSATVHVQLTKTINHINENGTTAALLTWTRALRLWTSFSMSPDTQTFCRPFSRTCNLQHHTFTTQDTFTINSQHTHDTFIIHSQ